MLTKFQMTRYLRQVAKGNMADSAPQAYEHMKKKIEISR